MLHPNLPQQQAGKNEQAGCNGQQGIVSLSPAKEIQKGIILDQRIGHYKGTQEQNMPAVNADRIFSIFSGPVCENIHKFQPFHSEKADRSIDQEEAAKDHRAADQHQDDSQDFWKSPVYIADRKPPDEHDDSLQDASDPGKFYMAAQNLKNFISRTDHDAVKFSFFDYSTKHVKTSCKGFRQGKFH